MKRNDLKIGEAYYYDSSTNWADASYTRGSKAVVVDGERYTIVRARFGFRTEVRYKVDPKGTAVLVDVYYGDDKLDRRAVPAAHLRGPWETTRTEVEAARNARLERQEAARAREDDLRKRADDAVAQAGVIGVKASVHNEYRRDVEIRMSVPEFQRLLGLIERTAITRTGD